MVKVLDSVPLWTVNKGYSLTLDPGNNGVDKIIDVLLTEAQVASCALGVQEPWWGEASADKADVVLLLVVHVPFCVTFVGRVCVVDRHRLENNSSGEVNMDDFCKTY